MNALTPLADEDHQALADLTALVAKYKHASSWAVRNAFDEIEGACRNLAFEIAEAVIHAPEEAALQRGDWERERCATEAMMGER